MLGDFHIDWKIVSAVATLANILFSIAIAIHTRSSKRIEDMRKAMGDGDKTLKELLDSSTALANKRLSIHSNRLDDHGLRITRLEEKINGLPSRKDLEKISDCVTEISKDVAANTERTNATFDLLRSIQGYLLGNRK